MVRLVSWAEWREELFLLEVWEVWEDEWVEWARLVRDWPALWSNCIRQNMRSDCTSSNAYGGLVITYLVGGEKESKAPIRNKY